MGPPLLSDGDEPDTRRRVYLIAGLQWGRRFSATVMRGVAFSGIGDRGFNGAAASQRR